MAWFIEIDSGTVVDEADATTEDEAREIGRQQLIEKLQRDEAILLVEHDPDAEDES